MTKRLTIALVAVALFVLMAVMPVSAAVFSSNGTVINQSAAIFIGEEGLNVTHALNQAFNAAYPTTTLTQAQIDGAPADTVIGWWASAAAVTTTSPTKTVPLATRYRSMTVAPADFVGYTGNWYLIDNSTNKAKQTGLTGDPVVVFTVYDPSLEIAVWDFSQGTGGVTGSDVTGKSVPHGEYLGFSIKTNMVFDNTESPAKRSNLHYMKTWADTGVQLLAGNQTLISYGGGDAAPRAWYSWNNGVWNNASTTAVTAAPYASYTNYTYYYRMVSYGSNSTYVPVNVSYNTAYFNYVNQSWASAADGTGVASYVTPTGWVSEYDAAGQYTWNTATDGYITLKVKDESGTTLNKLKVGTETVYSDVSITKNFINKQPFFFGTYDSHWVTSAVDFNNQYLYPVGTYTVFAESALNKMKDNYKNAGADYTGKTVSQTGTVTLVSDTVKIEANKDSVVRSKPFSITVTGKPSTQYYVWVKGTNSMLGGYDDVPPMININQEKVYFDSALNAGAWHIAAATHPIGDYQYENGATKSIWENVATDANAQTAQNWNRTRYYALINTSTSGTRTVEFVTNNWTKAQKYTIRVEQNFPQTASGYGTTYNTGTVKSDEVDVKVEKGAVTIVAAGDQSYYLGEEIKFSGTNTETYKTYLFIMGPNLKSKGSNIQKDDPRLYQVTDGDASTFKVVDVNGDNTWSWKWGTSNVALDAGTYTIYAVSQPRDNDGDHLASAAYGTVSIIIKKPFVSATASQSTVAQGDKLFITGTAEGNPKGVMIWILGKNYPTSASGVKTESVNSDASFKYEVTQATTKYLYPGQYFVVVQHPMQNDEFDVKVAGAAMVDVYNMKLGNTAAGTRIFTLLGAGSLQGSDAAEALVQGINDPNVDDTYTKLQFLIEVPVIRIDAIGDKRVGDKFTITAQTNLAVDDEVLVQVYSSSFKPTQKSQSGEFSGATGTVKVAKGDAGMNKISFDVDSSTFKPDEYIVTADAVLQTATGTALFNVLEGPVPTAAPSVVITTVAPVVTTAAPVVTTVATVAPTPTKSPGYGALIALIGLGAVAFIVVRRH
jgi:PGF-CTERM protein